MKYTIGIFAMCIMIFTEGCSKHLSGNTAKATTQKEGHNDVAAPDKNISGLLPGTWKLSTIEIPDMAAKMATFGNQEDKDKLNKKLTQYQEALSGLTVIFGSDSTYKSSYSGQGDTGTWRLRKQELAVTSNINSSVIVYNILAADERNIKVQTNLGDIDIMMSLIKQ